MPIPLQPRNELLLPVAENPKHSGFSEQLLLTFYQRKWLNLPTEGYLHSKMLSLLCGLPFYMTDPEIEEIIAAAKRITENIEWVDDEDHSPCREFRVSIASDLPRQLFVKGSINPEASTLTFCVIDKAVGPIYRLDLGKDHRNPGGELTGELHKHKWTEAHKDRWAYVPDDIHGSADAPLTVWSEFCTEFNLTHEGEMIEPQPPQLGIFT